MKSSTDTLCDEKLNSIRRSVVDTGIKYKNKNISRLETRGLARHLGATGTPMSVDTPETPMSVDTPETHIPVKRPFKANTGTRDDWLTISKEVVAPLKPLYNRHDTMLMLDNALFSEAQLEMSPLVMYRRHQAGAFFSTHHSPAHLEDDGVGESPNVILVKMWGFAGMHDAEDMISHYKNGVDALFKMKSFEDAMNTGAHIVLHFDGDAAYEDEDDLFSHNLFAPYVAKMIKNKTRKNVHLVITKVAKLKEADESKKKKKQTPLDIVKKFCNSADFNHSCSFRTETTQGGHCYPYYDGRFFASAALYHAEPSQTMPTGSEGQNSQMMKELFKGRIKARFCLCIGGNTMAGGVKSMQRLIEFNEENKFDGAVRVDVTATGKLPRVA